MNRHIVLSAFLLLTFGSCALNMGVTQESKEEILTETEIVVPEGTVIPIVLTEYLNTRNSQVGDVFYADTTYPIWIQQRLVVPKGSTIRGTVTDVVRPGRVRGKGRIAVRFDDILLPNGIKRDLIASFRGIHGPGDESLSRKSETVTAGGSKGEDVGTIIGTGSQGAIIGAIAGRSGSGAAIGAGAGAAVGAAITLFSRGRDLVINPGTRFDIELTKPMKFAYGEIDFTSAEIDSAARELREIRSRPTNEGSRNRNITGGETLGRIIPAYPF
jgi:hypothetical protein